MKISLGSDHAGFGYKEEVKQFLQDRHHEIKDFGTFSEESVDYPDFIRPAAEAVAKGECECGVVIGGSGNGEAIVANKVAGIRCAVCWNVDSARLAKEHNNANMISVGQRIVPLDTVFQIVEIWLNASFEGGRHLRRVLKIEKD